MLAFLYQTVPGRFLLKLLVRPRLSVLCGRFLDSSFSRFLIPVFIKRNHIDLSEYEKKSYRSFNDCFSRQIRPEMRPVDADASHLIAPCDGLLSAYRIREGSVIPVKHSAYTLEALLKDAGLAGEFDGGDCLVFRLCVQHYHRYIWAADGVRGENIRIPGVLHTVQPIALRNRPVFVENTREYTVLESSCFGKMVQMEVGAMLVGRIANRPGSGPVRRGEEKGCFEYGGSTVILLLKAGAARIRQEYFDAAAQDREVPVLQGRRIDEDA